MHSRLFSTLVYCLLTLLQNLVQCTNLQEILSPTPNGEIKINDLAISTVWQGLGPFKLGTREVVWGADPLEAFGGFRQLTPAKSASYPSSFLPNATLGWSEFEGILSETTDTVTVQWTISHPEVEWQVLQQFYGWSSLQYQTWIRGEIHNNSPFPQCVSVFAQNVLEYYINDRHVFGADFYGFQRAPMRIYLKPGRNVVNLRLIRDVRALGGLRPPTTAAALTFEPCLSKVRVVEHTIVTPELVDGKLSSKYLGVTIQNLDATPIDFYQCNNDIHDNDIQLLTDGYVRIAAGQALSLSLIIGNGFYNRADLSEPILVHLCYSKKSPHRASISKSIDFAVSFQNKTRNDSRRITFLHPSGVVSYAFLKPPDTFHKNDQSVPLMVSLHGSGVDIDDDPTHQTMKDTSSLNAAILFPSGMSSWCGDDWHTWGLSDVLAAINAVEDWQISGQWEGPAIDTRRFLLAGHSNGGQGTWYIASHLPDRVLAAVPASGYTSIENYIPYDFWTITDQSYILNAARKNFHNELFIENLANIPILQQHGSIDDNVPPYNSRLMSTLRAQAQIDSNYMEVPDKNHWWEGAMSTAPLLHFYHEQLSTPVKPLEVPKHFIFIIPNSHDVQSRYGIVVDQLRTPNQIGRIEIHVDHHRHIWHAHTSNIHRFHIDHLSLIDHRPKQIFLDHETQPRPVENRTFVLSPLGSWIAEEADWKTLSARYGRQRGAMDAILRTQGPFQIVDFTEQNEKLAVQISLNLLQYFGASSNISNASSYKEILSSTGNVITLSMGNSVPEAQLNKFPITFSSKGITFRTSQRPHRLIHYSEGLGLAMLRPLAKERLELLVWGFDEVGLRQAMRLVPTLTGAGQPDFAILSSEARWRGHGGALALGFFDHDWEISAGSYVW